MKPLKKTVAAVLGIATVIALGACNNNTEETTAAETSASSEAVETTVEETTVEETTDVTVETEGPLLGREPWEGTTETVPMKAGQLLGFEDWYCERTINPDGFTTWEFFTADGTPFGTQFGFYCQDEPNIKIRDIDGDGINELISFCVFGGDGAGRIYIYRNNNGTIEEGSLNGGDYVLAYNEIYDEEQDKMFHVDNFADKTGKIPDPVEIKYEDFTYAPYEYQP